MSEINDDELGRANDEIILTKVLHFSLGYVIIKKNMQGCVPLKKGKFVMKHIKTINKANLKETAAKGGCGKCQASCQSACKTSCTVANQKCER